MKKKHVLLMIGAGLVLSCVACCCGGYLSIPPTDIVGRYDDEPVTVAGSWQEQWEFKDSGVGTVVMKTSDKDKTAVVHFKYHYARQVPAVRLAWFMPEISAHSLELSECAGEAGALPPKGLGTPGEPDRRSTLVKSRRFNVCVSGDNVILAPEDPVIPAVVLKRR